MLFWCKKALKTLLKNPIQNILYLKNDRLWQKNVKRGDVRKVPKKCHEIFEWPLNNNTGGPRYSRAKYSRFRLFAVEELLPKLAIRGPFPRLFAVMRELSSKLSINWPYIVNTVLPRYSRFWYSRNIYRT